MCRNALSLDFRLNLSIIKYYYRLLITPKIHMSLPVESGYLPQIPEAKKPTMLNQLAHLVKAVGTAVGLGPDLTAYNYENPADPSLKPTIKAAKQSDPLTFGASGGAIKR